MHIVRWMNMHSIACHAPQQGHWLWYRHGIKQASTDLHHIGPVEIEENRPKSQHLLAMVRPAGMDKRQEGERVGRLPEQLLEPRLDVQLALAAQPVVDGRG